MQDDLDSWESFLARTDQSGARKGPRPRLDMGLLEVDLALAGFTVLLAAGSEALPSEPLLSFTGRLTMAFSLTSGGIHILWWFLGPSAPRLDAALLGRLGDTPLGRLSSAINSRFVRVLGDPYKFANRLAYVLLALGWLTFVGGLMGRGD